MEIEYKNRCCECNSSELVQLHHRVFRSEGEQGIVSNLDRNRSVFKESYGYELGNWKLNDKQNLVSLCKVCHLDRIHNGDEELRIKYRDSYTNSKTGFNIPFLKPKRELY